MDLRKKLHRYKKMSQEELGASSLPEDKRERIERLRSLIGEVVQRDRNRDRTPRQQKSPQWERLVGQQVTNEVGSIHIIEELLEPEHCHGRVPVAGALQVDPTVLARLALDPSLEQLDVSRILILDTETTGLAGGTGTVPFLVGLAWFEQGVLHIEQLLLRDFGQEEPLLHRLSEHLARCTCLVTYNGKSFDWPLLRTRFIMNRVPLPPLLHHLDLLHCARRVLKPRLGTVRLIDLETELLDFYREGDVDGSEIPAIYLNFLRGADPQTLLPVIEHNANDVIALAAILGKLTQHFQSVHPQDDPRDHLAYARVAVRAQDYERAYRFAHAAAEGAGSDNVALDAFILTARLARRNGDWEASGEALSQALENAHDEQSESQVHLALAKLYEHKLKDLSQALVHAQYTEPAEGQRLHEKRRMRIEHRLARQEQK